MIEGSEVINRVRELLNDPACDLLTARTIAEAFVDSAYHRSYGDMVVSEIQLALALPSHKLPRS